VRRALAALLLALLAALAAQAAPTVILLSFDGVRHDMPARVPGGALARMQREGAAAERLVPVFPSSTFPGHVSLATGTYPDRHGIVDNQFIDRERGEFRMDNDASWIQAEPLWAAAERQGVPAAVYFWVGSETDWRGQSVHQRVAPFDASVDESEKVARILGWLDLPGASRPRLILSWWHGADHAGHQRGPDDAGVARALREQDAALGQLLAALDARHAWSDTTLLVVSDHGMTAVTSEVPLARLLADAGVRARIGGGGSVAQLFLADPAQRERAEAALAGRSGIQVVRGEALPEALRLRHPTRTGDLVVIASPGVALRESPRGERALRVLATPFGWKRGMHGFAPDHPDMGGILLALGRGVAPGTRLPPQRMIDVAPTVARLLGIAPPASSEGRPIAGIGE
jgi:predicted AlkP superfamily pyrophosphatase or phosphodiesterase